MAESKATAPSFYLQSNIDMTRCFEARAQIKAAGTRGRGGALLQRHGGLKACAIALREFPRANGAYRDGKWEIYSRVNVGIAVAASDALVVPTIFDADTQGATPDLHRGASAGRAGAATARLPRRSSRGRRSPSPTSACTGSRTSTRSSTRPRRRSSASARSPRRRWSRDGEVTVAQQMGVTLVCDHRILYGAEGAEFLARVRSLLRSRSGSRCSDARGADRRPDRVAPLHRRALRLSRRAGRRRLAIAPGGRMRT